jgi:sulfate transport system ATP-binding protein
MQLHLQGLTKHYPGVAALDGIDLDIASGELVALLGPSGSGKTTLLRVIGGLLHADQGRVLFDDIDATRLSLRERNVGFVFQHYALFRHMTVAENIAFGLRSRPRARRPDKATINKRVQELLQLVQLPEHGGRYPDQLSGGQKQRIALARALAIDPSVLLLDEPFGALDAKVRVELRRWLRKLHERTGQTTLFVTHDQDEALELADRVVVMRAGKVEQVGTPDQIYHARHRPTCSSSSVAPTCWKVASSRGASSRVPCNWMRPARRTGRRACMCDRTTWSCPNPAQVHCRRGCAMCCAWAGG